MNSINGNKVSLPISAKLTDQDVDDVVKTEKKVLKNASLRSDH